MKKIKKFKDFCIQQNQNILTAMEKLNNNNTLFLIVVNKDNQLLGTITDGDIRRYILRGRRVDDNIELAMNKKPIFSYTNNEKNYKKKLLSSPSVFKFLPVVSKTKVIEYILVYEKEEINNIVLIMAGGYGKRLGNKTKSTPKPLLKVGKNSILDIIIKKINKVDFYKIYISTHYLHEKIKRHIEIKHKRNKINLIYEKNPMGTAGCISMINDDFSNLVVINGDIISNIDIKSLLTYHNDTKNDITLTVAKYSYKVPFGLVELDKNQHLKFIREKPSVDYDVISGIYCIRKSICDTVNHEYLDMTTLISNSIKLKKKIGVFPIHEYWKDVGNPDDLVKAKNEYDN